MDQTRAKLIVISCQDLGDMSGKNIPHNLEKSMGNT
jgi:hypothetical protein